jgi:hypothetical protein
MLTCALRAHDKKLNIDLFGLKVVHSIFQRFKAYFSMQKFYFWILNGAHVGHLLARPYIFNVNSRFLKLFGCYCLHKFVDSFLLLVQPDDKYEFSEPSKIQSLVKNYSQFVSFPIFTWQEKSRTVEVIKLFLVIDFCRSVIYDNYFANSCMC